MSVLNELNNQLLLGKNENKDTLKVYHGTIDKHINNIKKNGLVSPLGYDRPKWYMVSTDFESALFHSNADEDQNIKPIVVEFDIPLEKHKRRWVGFPYLWSGKTTSDNDTWYALKQPIPSEFISKVHNVSFDKFKDARIRD
jgi:hypothetical protein